jgi:translation initiation factor 2 subunit 2
MSYTLDELLTLCYNDIKGNKKSDIKVEQPKITNINRKSYIENFTSICTCIKREIDSVQKFMDKGLATKSSITDEGSLKFENSFPIMRVKDILVNYIRQYVVCSACQSKDTIIKHISRENILICNSCKCEKTVQLP